MGWTPENDEGMREQAELTLARDPAPGELATPLDTLKLAAAAATALTADASPASRAAGFADGLRTAVELYEGHLREELPIDELAARRRVERGEEPA